MGVMCIALASFRPVSGVHAHARGPGTEASTAFPARLSKIETCRLTEHGRSLGV